jgi:acyl carrier protein
VVRWINVDAVSADVVTELFGPADAPAEIALSRGRRWLLEHTQLTVPEAAPPVLREGGRYLITGGTGGIGVTLAEDFALRVRAKLILLTRGGLPPREEWDAHLAGHGGADRAGRAMLAVRRMETAGAVVHVLAADVTDPARLREVRELAEREFGGLDGIVHAAGLPGGGVAEVKERAAAEAVLAPKIAGTLALAEAFADLPMDFVALCSSVTAVSGDFGQVDYCAANNFLDAYARGDHGWQARVVSHDWGGWDEVGMAAEVAAPTAIRSTRTRADGPVAHPVLTTRTGGDCHGLVSAAGHWLLGEHRIAGVPVVPGTGHLETVRAAVEAALPKPGDGHVVELRDVAFLEPFSVPEGTTAEYRVAFDGDGFAVTSRAGGTTKVHVRGSAGWVPAPSTSTVDLDAVRTRTGVLDDGNAFGTGRTSMVTFGPRWAALRTHHVGEHEELASLVAPEAAASDTGWVLHPALLDVATAFGRGRGSGTYLPMSYGRVVVHHALPASFHSHLRYRDGGGDQVVAADLTLCDDNGGVLVEIEDFVLRQVDEGAVSGGLAAAAPKSAGKSAPTSTVDSESAGIRPVDGAEAFLRALTPGLGGQVVISTRPVRDLFDRRVTAERLEETEEVVEAGHPQQQDDYVAPRTDLEAEIARQWAEVLGVERIGVHDDFFALGGNSLVAIQLIAQVRKTTGARLAMKTLFESSTVATLVERIEELRAGAAPAAEPAPTAIPKLER